MNHPQFSTFHGATDGVELDEGWPDGRHLAENNGGGVVFEVGRG